MQKNTKNNIKAYDKKNSTKKIENNTKSAKIAKKSKK
jgi:hypothetical protein